MIGKLKYSYVYTSDMSPRDDVGVKNVVTDNASDVGPIFQYTDF